MGTISGGIFDGRSDAATISSLLDALLVTEPASGSGSTAVSTTLDGSGVPAVDASTLTGTNDLVFVPIDSGASPTSIVPTSAQLAAAETWVVSGTGSVASTLTYDTSALTSGSSYHVVLSSNGDLMNTASGTTSSTSARLDVAAGSGNDTITLSDTTNVVLGNQGDDMISSGAGNDTMFGGQGADTLSGGSGDDLLYGNKDGDVLYGNDNNDVVLGNEGADTLYGDAGLDSLFGGQDGDLIYGGVANDLLDGNLGNDTLYGGDGVDTLVGGGFEDLMEGGGGQDVYKFFGAFGDDTIQGFEKAQDVLSLSKDDSGGVTLSSVDDLSSHISSDSSGNAVVTLGGDTITLTSITASDMQSNLSTYFELF